MSNCKEYLAGMDTPDIKLFREKFNTYRQSLDNKEVSALMKKYPGEGWRIILIEQSGLKLPPLVEKAVEEYKKNKLIEEERIKKISLFLDSPESKKVGNIYVKYKYWHMKTYCQEPDIDIATFKLIREQNNL